ncbi:MAG: hypothetical protein AAF495_14615 [Pseudomonadota bacterium]
MGQQERIDTARRIAIAWEKTGIPVTCDLCGHRDWGLVATNGADGVGFPLWQSSTIYTGEIYLTYAVECKKCGNVRMMSKARVEELASSEKATVG